MATERELELLDDYLRNRLSGEDKVAFEQKLQADPELQSELQLQQQLVSGLKNARVAELKAMLNNVPLSSIPTSGPSVLTKVAGGVVVTAAIFTTVYFLIRQEQLREPVKVENAIPETTEGPKEPGLAEQSTDNAGETTPPANVTDDNRPKATPKTSTPPKIEVYDPTEDAEGTANYEGQDESIPGSTSKAAPSISVNIEREDKTYNYHYQFRDGKLFLYGPFESNLYEILEFFTEDKHTIFLYHKDDYFLLKEYGEQIKPLVRISDPALLKKLKEYREKQ